MDEFTAKKEAKDKAIAQLNRRNTETVEVVLREMQKEITEIKIVIASLNNGIGGLIERQNLIEQKINIQKVQLMGLGPSVRE
ncbi:hypothetical protein KJ925_02970 [Patescibacteria group bacterium]|nr:hypothetical protein [Patescibacteria group bacterium]